MKITEIYVRINGYLIQEIIIYGYWKSNQQYMLDHLFFNEISIYTYRPEIFLTFMLSDGVYITSTLKQLKAEK